MVRVAKDWIELNDAVHGELDVLDEWLLDDSEPPSMWNVSSLQDTQRCVLYCN
jgi:hypothetical protein